MEEDSVNDNVPGSVIADEQTDQLVQHEIVESSTQRGKKETGGQFWLQLYCQTEIQ